MVATFNLPVCQNGNTEKQIRKKEREKERVAGIVTNMTTESSGVPITCQGDSLDNPHLNVEVNAFL